MPQATPLTHLDPTGAARMVDVGGKPSTPRTAVASAKVRLGAAAKRTPELIPLCHPLPISSVAVDFELEPDAVRVIATARVSGQTGVEMEALTAAAVAGLTLIDMVKGVEQGVELESVRLLSKSGGKSGDWTRPPS